MNKIYVGEDIKFEDTDQKIILTTNKENKFFNVCDLRLKIIDDTDLFLEFNSLLVKADIYINVLNGAHVNIYEIKHEGDYKLQYKFYLEENSYLNVENVIDATEIKEMTIVNLNGEGASINYNLKTISKMYEKYNFLVYHNAKNTVSHIRNNGVNILDGTLEFNVSSFVSNGITGCDINQSARIINMTENTCSIKPNLFIDEEDVVANHSALIGTFSSDEIFYLMSRGISKKESENLLTKGFLLNGITYYKDILEEIINKYWR